MIEVRIRHDATHKAHHDTLVGERMVMALRRGGVPVLGGRFVFTGVRHGVLSMYCEDFEGGPCDVLRWRENDQDRETNFKVITVMKKGQIVSMSGIHRLQEEDEL